ncbi:alpha/beta hydrolase family protein [Sphingomonas sp. Leaf357]|uniref:alpha/beta hydrolase family protein n=1 Tax=Sphingomonas sp. Leaf357 TaxID=1736350 RepID=UPI0009ECC181|nr:S9 family peptidase [Sphingomonas sp. Leaf357]
MLQSKRIAHVLLTAGAAITLSGNAAPDVTFDAAAAFGAREGVSQMSLSPDGTHIAMISPTKGKGSVLLIADLVKGGKPVPILRSSGEPDRLTGCNWTSNVRLICSIYLIDRGTQTLAFTRLVSIGSDGRDQRQMSARTNSRSLGILQDGGSIIDWLPDDPTGKVLMTRQFIPESSLGTHISSSDEGLGVEMVDPAGTQRRVVVPPRFSAVEYITDGHGTVRMMGLQPRDNSGYLSSAINYLYSLPAANEWKPFGTLNIASNNGSGFNPYAVDRYLNIAYGFDRLDGRNALYSVALDGSLKRQLVFARPDVDVSGLIRVGRQNRVVGASFVTDRRESEFFDPALRKLRVSLGKALPGQPLVTFLDASADEGTLLMFAGSDMNAGRYYVYHKATKQLEEVLSARPQLDSVTLSQVKSITFPAADGTLIPAYLTLPPGSDSKNIPAIVMPHGGPGARDEWGFDWLSQFFANRGYAVLQPNYRGSTGYGDAWFQKNGFQSWRAAIGDVNDAGRWLRSQGIAAPGKLAIVGWSYGGYAALQSSVLDPDLFKAIVAIAPVTDLEMLRTEANGYTNFKLVDAFIGKGAHVVQGSPARNAGQIKAPVLMFHGDLDRNVGVEESRYMADKLKDAGRKVDYVEFKGLDHYLDDDTVRTEMLAKSDAFLRTSLGL